MASLCNSLICVPTAVPAGIPASGGAILRDAFLIRCTPPLSSRAKYNLRTSKASAPKAYVFPDPDPMFAASETRKFKAELLRTVSKEKETFGNDLPTVVNVCAEVHDCVIEPSTNFNFHARKCFEEMAAMIWAFLWSNLLMLTSADASQKRMKGSPG
ncbi:protein PLASTID REDOX INSENSITIVE 2, chloroplastic-like [Primulina tabacum]|uniref:protein PLASTID REDOX INSENSITIVE 2, chloroplastic-like n=1 Tax=Primulina tabacum TaxID=48773 RepID=UPI003F5A4A1A